MSDTHIEDNYVAPFCLQNTNANFYDRTHNIFAGLDVLEDEHLCHEENRTDTELYSNLNPVNDSYFKSECHVENPQTHLDEFHCGGVNLDNEVTKLIDEQSDVFPESENNANQDDIFCQPTNEGHSDHSGIPDHGKHPFKCVHYSLEDIGGSNMSEKANTRAAITFFDKQQKFEVQTHDETDDEHAFDTDYAACSKGRLTFIKPNKAKN